MLKRRFLKQIIASLTAMVMLLSIFPVSAFSSESKTENYGIEVVDRTDVTIDELDVTEDEQALSGIVKESESHKIGVYGTPPLGIPLNYGKIYSPFKLSGKADGLVQITMDKPNISEDNMASSIAKNSGERYKIAVQDAQDTSSAVFFVSTEIGDNEKLVATIPLGESGNVVCAVVQENTQVYKNGEGSDQPPAKYGEQNEMVAPEIVLENASDSISNHFTWTYEMSDNTAFGNVVYQEINAEIKLDTGRMELDESSIQVTSKAFEKYTVTKESDGTYTITLSSDKDPQAKIEGLFDPIEVSFDASLSPEKFDPEEQLYVLAQITIGIDSTSNSMAITETSLLNSKVVTTMKSAVTITPADLTIYEGGDGGYEGVYGDEETATETKLGSTSLPHPLFEITGPKAAGPDFDPTQVTFRTKPVATEEGQEAVPEKEWKVVSAGENSDLYYFEPVKENQDPVRVTYSYFDENGEKVNVTNDAFDPADFEEGFGTLQIDLYPGNNAADFSNIEAVRDKDAYAVSTNSGTLTVRAVNAEDPSDVTSEIKNAAPAVEEVEKGEAVAVAPADTVYTLNDKDVPLPTDGSANPSLLFDDIIDAIAGQPGTTRTQLLNDAIDKELGAANGERHTLIKYLDLVDTMNGNAWISSSEGTDIYWRYPEGTDMNTQFKVLHFENLHRDNSGNGMSGFDPADIESATITEVTGVSQDDNFIKFHVDKGGFSPYALVWDVADEEDPSPGPDPDTPVGPVHPVDPTPELERGDHYAYIVGYEDDTIRPQNNITRAEVATIFFRLLTDESREAYFTTDCDFTDVNGSAWYANTVATLSNAGILAGYPDGSFRPNDPITRAEFAAIATRFDDLAAADSTFTDIDGHWAEDAINAAYGAGWVGGYPDGTFRPNNNITRAEVMSLVNRVLDREVDEDGMLDDMLTWTDNEPGTWYYEAVQEATNSHDYEREDVDSLETWTQINEPIDWDKVEDDLLNN